MGDTGPIAAIGEPAEVQGYALAGVTVLHAEGPDAVRSAWRGLDEHTAVVILTEAAAAHLTDELAAAWPLTAVLPS
ncbi:V-type ATP synthase subunit F [Promicromonospora soli]